MSASPTSTNLPAPLLERGRVALRDPKATLESIATAMLTDDVPAEFLAVAPQAFPAVPAHREITAAQAEALIALPSVFGTVQPTERRALTDDEVSALYKERQVLKTLGDLLSGREEDIKTLIRHHMDVSAEERGVAVPKAVVRDGQVVVEATPRDASGHYILCAPKAPERCPIPGTSEDWSREYRSGKVEIDLGALERLHEEGVVSREDYLAFTREVRVIDKAKVMEAIAKKPERLGLLAKISKRGLPGTSLFVRNRK